MLCGAIIMASELGSNRVEALCGNCQEGTDHQVLRERSVGDGTDLLLKCSVCGVVVTHEIRSSKAVKIPITLSDGDTSSFQKVDSDEDEVINVGDRFEHSDSHWEITRIEGQTGRKAQSLEAGSIKRGWARRVDRVVIPLTLTDGEVSRSSSIECSSGEVFSCESLIEVEGEVWRIRAIHTGNGRTLGGRRVADEIRRIYLHPE